MTPEHPMTEPNYTPSEQEIEAAARPIAEALYSDYWSAAGHGPEDCELSNAAAQVVENWMQDARPIARAALTAAAQVRERAPKIESGAALRLGFIADQVQSWLDWSRDNRAKENLTTDGDTAIMALPVPMWPRHVSLQNWVKALREGAMIASLWQADRAAGSSSGEDVLGQRKGEG